MTYRKIKRTGLYCDDVFCNRVAEYEVVDHNGHVRGRYCSADASDQVKMLKEAEDKSASGNHH